jgi:hypothetical protein
MIQSTAASLLLNPVKFGIVSTKEPVSWGEKGGGGCIKRVVFQICGKIMHIGPFWDCKVNRVVQSSVDCLIEFPCLKSPVLQRIGFICVSYRLVVDMEESMVFRGILPIFKRKLI